MTATELPPPNVVETLRSGRLFRFCDWPNKDVPRAAAGVYTVWDKDGQFIYVGMAGRAFVADTETIKTTGLFSRLASHASGRRSGDQFCVYVADRLVLATLTGDEIAAISEGRRQLDAFVHSVIHQRLLYRFVVVPDKQAAYRLERESWTGPHGAPV